MGLRSSEMESFPSDRFNEAISSELLMKEVMEILIRLAGDYKDGLVKKGQTEEILEEGRALLSELAQRTFLFH